MLDDKDTREGVDRSSADDEIEIYVEDDEPGQPDGEEIIELTESDLMEEVGRLTQQVADLREQYLRKLAEFDNFRKRTERERIELERTASEELVRELVPVLDNFERAMAHGAEQDPDGFHQGVEMIARQLWETLQRRGLEVMNPLGEQFSPEFHEAVQRVEDPGHEPGTVATVLAKGYLFGGRLLRPAMVAVAVATTPPGAVSGGESEGGS